MDMYNKTIGQTNMKKAIIVIAVFLLFGLAAGLISSQFVYSPAPITLAERNQLDADFSEFLHDNYVPKWYSDDEPLGYCRIYGRDNGYIIFYFRGGFRIFDTGPIVIDGIAIGERDAPLLYAYKNGEFILLQEAYEQGLISRAALIAAADYHRQCDERIKEELERLANERK